MSPEIALETLAELRANLPDCTLVLCCDLRSGTVLASDGDLTYPQEYLDALSRTAQQVLAPQKPDQDMADFVLVSEISGLRLFSNHPAAPELGLACLATFEVDVARTRSMCRSALATLAQGDMI